MPNAINPFNYNIDKFDSGFLGPISDTSFRDYLFTYNLGSVDPIISGVLGNDYLDDRGKEYDVSQRNPHVMDVPNLEEVSNIPSIFNNFTEPKQDNLAKNPTPLELSTWYPGLAPTIQQAGSSLNTPYGVSQTLKLGFIGNVESWVTQGGYLTTTHEIRDLKLFAPENNKWGPAEIIAYNDPDTPPQNTGFIQYNTIVQGDFRDQLFKRSLGVGIVPFSRVSSGINYKPDGTNPSELDLIARKQRGIELANRLKLNFIDDTVGAINTSPFGLLAGGSLINRDYTITVPKTGVGKAAQFVANLAGFNLPTSIIPDDAFQQTTGQQIDIPNALLDYTGSGQKSLLFDALYINKYGPTLGDAYSPPSSDQVKKNLAGAGQPPNTRNYLSEPQQPPTEPREKSFIDTLNDKVDALFNSQQPPTIPTEDFSMTDPTKVNETFGFDTLISPTSDTWGTEDYKDSDSIGVEMPATELPDNHKPMDNLMYWGDRTNRFKKGILKYTQDLVNKSINNPDAAGRFIGVVNSDLNYNENGSHIRYSNGNTTVSETDGSYCRSWSVRRPYDSYNDLIRSEKNWWRIDSKHQNLMTLTDAGVPKIAWDRSDTEASAAAQIKTSNSIFGAITGLDLGGEVTRHIVPYMFSIENLAWKDSPQYAYLPLCEKGPNGGRIMWFPPYNMDFSDNTSVSWDNTTFIGRGEPIYTYNHTERSGSLSFSVVVDHPSVLNELRDQFKDKFTNQFELIDGKFHSFFGGCSDVKELFKNYLPETPPTPKKQDDKGIIEPQPITPKTPENPPKDSVKIYFPNARTDNKCGGTKPDFNCKTVNTTQEGRRIPFSDGYETSPLICGSETRPGLNEGVESDLDKMAQFLVGSEGKNYKIIINGFCSGTANIQYNQKLGLDRALATRDYILTLMQGYEEENGGPPKYEGTDKTYKSETLLQNSADRWSIESKGELLAAADTQDEDWKFETPIDPCTANGKNENSWNSKISRYVEIKLEKTSIFSVDIEQEINNESQSTYKQAIKEQEELKASVESIAKNYINECDYFMKIKENNPFIYNSFTEKLDNFHPAFHAITPEGLNSRITFLQQCTRQGPQMMDLNAPQNMVFGRPPVCVLKIGDFYHTKIIMDSVNFTFDPLQWDLNPEGIGVQPMVVKVDISFKFIGGSSLGGPIKQLQNAVSYNFFANTGIYKPVTLVENYLAKRENFVTTGRVAYGAFITPEEANNTYQQLYDELKKSVSSNKNDDNTNQNKPDAEQQKIVNEKSATDSTQSSSGGVPSPPVGGNTLNDVLYEANYSSDSYKILQTPYYSTVTSKTNPDARGIFLGNNNYIRFDEGGKWYLNKDGVPASDLGTYNGFGTHNDLIMTSTKTSKVYKAPSLTLLLNQL